MTPVPAPEPHIRGEICSRFLAAHPFELSDGRRFASLNCAARSAVDLGPGSAVTGPDGRQYSYLDCKLLINQLGSGTWEHRERRLI